MPIFVGNSTVNTAIANSTLTVDQTQNFAYATSNRNSIRPSLNLDFTRSQTVDPRITFTRASSATYFNSRGVLTTATTNVPRIDYNPITGACNGLLIEQASTNLITDSGDVSTFGTIFSTLTANAAISPDGTTTAALMIPSVDLNNNHYINKVWNGSVGNSITFTVSIFAKTAGYQWIRMNVGNAMGGGYLFFDIINGVVGGYGGVSNPVIQACGNGWFRCSYQFTTPATGTGAVGHQIYGSPSNNNFSNWSGNGTSGYYFWGAQVEQLSFLTSYIPTTGSTATRSTDTTSLTGTNFSSWYNSTNWTAIVTAVPAKIPNPSTSASQSIFEFRLDGSNRVLARINSSSSVITAYWLNSLSLPSNSGGYNTPTLTENTMFKYGITASNDSWNLAFNGSIFISAALGYLITPTDLWIGYSPSDTLGFTGWIQRIAYYPVVLPNAELQTLTL